MDKELEVFRIVNWCDDTGNWYRVYYLQEPLGSDCCSLRLAIELLNRFMEDYK